MHSCCPSRSIQAPVGYPEWSVSGCTAVWTYISVLREMNIGMEVGRESGSFTWYLGSSNGLTWAMNCCTTLGLQSERKEPWAERQEPKFLALVLLTLEASIFHL